MSDDLLSDFCGRRLIKELYILEMNVEYYICDMHKWGNVFVWHTKVYK